MNIATQPEPDLASDPFCDLAFALARRALRPGHAPEDGALACAVLDRSPDWRDICMVSERRNLLWAAAKFPPLTAALVARCAAYRGPDWPDPSTALQRRLRRKLMLVTVSAAALTVALAVWIRGHGA